MPFAAFTMACILFVYSRTSIRLAKENARAHREADGGQISWRNQSLRQHGLKEQPVGALKIQGAKVVYAKKDLDAAKMVEDENPKGNDSKIIAIAKEKRDSA